MPRRCLGQGEVSKSFSEAPLRKDGLEGHLIVFDNNTKMYIMVYMATITKTATILNIKTDKKLKAEAKAVADGMGVPLGTIINSFLKQFVREREITFSAKVFEPSPFLVRALKAADAEYKAGKVQKFSSVEALMTDLMK